MGRVHDPKPPVWTRAELAEQRIESINAFIAWWKGKGATAYREHFATALDSVGKLFSETNNLVTFDASALRGRAQNIREVARYLAGPPLSEDDLKIVAGVTSLWTLEHLEAVTSVIRSVIDTERFPWLIGDIRQPEPSELEAAKRWTAGLLAAQKAATERRLDASKRQEQAVDDVMQAAPLGFQKVVPRQIRSVRDIDPGQYCRQSMVGGTRADLTVGLKDRLLVIECKVSNSEVNSYKRLNHEIGDKASRWNSAFGEQAVPAAVLAGAFSLANLEAAQDAGLSIFWEHELRALVEFVEAAME